MTREDCRDEESNLAREIKRIGFSCTRCGDCCRPGAGDDNLVMVFPREIRAISEFSGLEATDIAEPYPDTVTLPGDRTVTFGRALRRFYGDCRFLSGSSCLVYPVRPSICRTYPFMLEGSELRIYPCRGLGKPISREDAVRIARDLLTRRAEEEEEIRRIQAVFPTIPPGPGRYLVDGEGVCMQ
ncbi:MAG: YkgJ family cysteine cluster protein [Methanolinea sp.]|nr:YkgJ family cysteine cluster protein [Methanolinea sp.]